MYESGPNRSFCQQVWRTLRAAGRHPYHFRGVQGLQPTDPPQRLQYCQWFLDRIHAEQLAGLAEGDRSFLTRTLMTDEATFTRAGIFNQHNEHYWAEENPRLAHEDSFQ